MVYMTISFVHSRLHLLLHDALPSLESKSTQTWPALNSTAYLR